ncbi:viroplasmin family protein [Patescibacteria group bacterium]|nr:viroplasmin family protein [Patescibacteria group bacterium]
MKNTVTIYTDGSSRGNPGPGGWAAILMTDTQAIELAGNVTPATNNQMELLAVEKGLEYAQKHFGDYTVLVHADSTYVLRGLESWLDGWKRNGWLTATKKPVENKSQWQALLELRDHFGKKLELVKVEGHSGHTYNDRCDELAVAAALKNNYTLFDGTIKDYEAELVANPPQSVQKPTKKPGATKKETGPAYSYVSMVNGKVFTDKTWAACEARVKGTKGAKYKKVFSKGEETGLIQDYTLHSLL